jgi:hypothetical protein
MTICAQDSQVHLNFVYVQAIDVGSPWVRAPCLKFWHKYSISPRQSPCHIGLANKVCWICHKPTQNVYQQFTGAPELVSNRSKSWGYAWNEPVSVTYSDTSIQYRHDLLYGQIEWPNLQCTIYTNRTHDIWLGFSSAPESGWIVYCSLFWLWNVNLATGFLCTSRLILSNDSKRFTASFLKLDWGYLSWDRPTWKHVVSLINWLHLLFVI